MLRNVLLLSLLGLNLNESLVFGCTTIGVGSGATVDGSTLASHSDDGLTDPRLIFVPSTTHGEGEFRNVYFDTEGYPRFIGTDRGPDYAPTSGQSSMVPIGQIPEIVGKTYARTEGTYGIMNEVGVGMAESTCSGIFSALALGHGGKALFSIDELSRVSLERCDSARCAVQLMGDLAVQYGFYGADSGTEGGSESLIVHDSSEVFIFHILPDDTGTSAIWAAQRVPDDHITVVANMFVIRAIDLSDSFNFLASPNIYSIAQKHGLWSPENGLLDFTAVYSDGEYGHRYYSGRRVWGVMGLLTPANPLADTYENLKNETIYPATLPFTNKLTVQDLFKAHRSYYEGTKYDQSVGIAAGPFGLPDRFSTNTKLPGNWERTPSIYRTAYSHVTQARDPVKMNLNKLQANLIWFGPHVASTTVYIPYSAGVTQLSKSLGIGSPYKLSRDSIYWAMRYVYNIKRIKHAPMMIDIVNLQSGLENEAAKLVSRLDNIKDIDTQSLNLFYSSFADSVFLQWWNLSDFLMEKYADGNDRVSYPDWWLKIAGYEQGPPPV